MIPAFDTVGVWLGAVFVGTIRMLTHGQDTKDKVRFTFASSYRTLSDRPVLGQMFEDDLGAAHDSSMRLPPFFSHLLPEGALRKLIATHAGESAEREFYLLAHVGEDLPGAVIARPIATPGEAEEESRVLDSATTDEDAGLKFSLAGVQLKFSMLLDRTKLTLPVSGQGGDWLVKLPHRDLEAVPENELAMMTWASRVGIDVPDVGLTPVRDLQGLPPEVGGLEGRAFRIRRFDRTAGHHRIHIEDFAQVLGQRRKYQGANFETLAKITVTLGGLEDLDQFIRRLVFIVAIGNSDAHLKNWSLIYRDGRTARLAPAYDLVSTIQYPEVDDHLLALNLGGSKRFEDVTLETFARLGARVGVDPAWAKEKARRAVARTRDVWDAERPHFDVPDRFKLTLDQHLSALPLFRHH